MLGPHLLLLTMVTTQDGDAYAPNAGIQQACEGGRAPVTSRSECREAASALGTQLNPSTGVAGGGMPHWPLGCFQSGLSQLFWNPRTTGGGATANHFVVCRVQEPPTSGLGYTNIGDGVCTNGGWGSRLTPFDTVAYAVSWRHPVGASAPFTGNDCAQLCTSIGDDCVGFNLPWTASSGCVIYTNPMGVVRAVNPPNGSFTNRPCWKKVGGDVSDYEFRIISGRQTWDQARGRCQAIGGDLASAHTIWHARAIYTTVIEARMWRAWIGLRDRTETNHFQWSDDTGSPDSADFAGWHRGFPMHTTAITEDHQNCAGVLGMYKTAASPGSWFNAHCDDIGMYACNPVDGEGSGGVRHNVVSARDFASCRDFVVRHHPLADGITYDPGTRACWAHFGMESIGSSCQGCQACQRTPIDDSVGFVCGIPTGNTAAPTTGPPSSPAPTPWFEHPGHRTNLSELQSRMVAAETQARDTAAVVEQMRVDLSRTRAALLRAVNTEPAMPRQCSGGGCSPAIAAIGDSVSISAPIGTVGVTTQTCEVDDLCGAGSFAENLKEALRSI